MILCNTRYHISVMYDKIRVAIKAGPKNRRPIRYNSRGNNVQGNYKGCWDTKPINYR